MHVTAFGDFVRRRRLDLGMTLKDMAGQLGVSNAFLSAVELGRKRIPDSWDEVLPKILVLSENQKNELLNRMESCRVAGALVGFDDEGLKAVVDEYSRNRAYITEKEISALLNMIRGFGERKGRFA
jgi:transcriptional regulator with XRE-family HTH domain